MPVNAQNFIDGIAVQKLKHTGVNQTPRLIVIHYSVTDTVAQAVSALNGASPPLGYHIFIAKDGTPFQTRPFTQSAAHPGLSNWKSEGGLTGGASVSRGSIGICLMNNGFGFAPGLAPAKIAKAKLIYNPDDSSMQEWERFTPEQIATCTRLVKDIIATYAIREVVGHQDIAIMGKFDPGPLFDLKALNDLIAGPKPLGLETKVKAGTSAELRKGPGAGAPSLGTLAAGTKLHIRSVAYGPSSQALSKIPSRKRYLTAWASVDTDGSNTHAGFVHMRNLTKTPLDPALAAKL